MLAEHLLTYICMYVYIYDDYISVITYMSYNTNVVVV